MTLAREKMIVNAKDDKNSRNTIWVDEDDENLKSNLA